MQISEIIQNKSPLSNKSANPTRQSGKEMAHYFPGLYAGKTSSSLIRPKQDIQAEISHDSNRKRFYKAAQEFEAIYVGQMLSAMRKNLHPENGLLFGGNRQKIFTDMLYDEYSRSLAKNAGFGMADQIYTQMSSALGPVQNDIEEPQKGSSGAAGYNVEQRYQAEKIRREMESARNRISTEQLLHENDWRP